MKFQTDRSSVQSFTRPVTRGQGCLNKMKVWAVAWKYNDEPVYILVP